MDLAFLPVAQIEGFPVLPGVEAPHEGFELRVVAVASILDRLGLADGRKLLDGNGGNEFLVIGDVVALRRDRGREALKVIDDDGPKRVEAEERIDATIFVAIWDRVAPMAESLRLSEAILWCPVFSLDCAIYFVRNWVNRRFWPLASRGRTCSLIRGS
jgi:hypothetical protein